MSKKLCQLQLQTYVGFKMGDTWGDNWPFQGIKTKEFISEWFSGGWDVEYKSGPPVFSIRGHAQVESKDNSVYRGNVLPTHTEPTDFWTLAEQSHSTGTGGLTTGLDLPGWGRLQRPTEKRCWPTMDHSTGPPAIRFPNHQSPVIKLLCFTLGTLVHYVGILLLFKEGQWVGSIGSLLIIVFSSSNDMSILEH